MTEITVVYEKFLSKIADYGFYAMTEQEIADDLYGYFDSARAKFYRCKNDLTTVEEIDGMKIVSKLIPYEIEILVALMLVEHITPKLLTDESLKQSLSDKDFKVYSQANQLREIRLILEGLESKSEKMITKYTFFDLEKENM
jgi:hypothetical protein